MIKGKRTFGPLPFLARSGDANKAGRYCILHMYMFQIVRFMPEPSSHQFEFIVARRGANVNASQGFNRRWCSSFQFEPQHHTHAPRYTSLAHARASSFSVPQGTMQQC